MNARDDRFLSVVVGALVAYALFETVAAYATERRERWAAWFNDFTAPFIRHPGRREWMRETLLREEMNVKDRANA